MYSGELLYKPIPIVHPTYEYTKIYPQTNVSTLSVTNGGDETIFEIPSKVFNLSKSVLSFTMTPIAANTLKTQIFAEGTPHLRSIQLYNRAGLFLCNINSLNKYMGSVTRYITDHSYFKTFDEVGEDNLNGYMDVLTKTNSASPGGYSDHLDMTSSDINNEPIYFIASANAGANSPVIKYQIPLGRIKDSIFGLDIDQCFNEVVYMRLIWEGASQIGFTSTTVATLTGVNSFAEYRITNQYLYLAGEVNDEIINHIVNVKIKEGLTYQVPYLYTNKLVKQQTDTSQSLSIRLNRSHGIKVTRIYFVPFVGAEAINTTLNHSNTFGVVVQTGTPAAYGIKTYYTTIDNKRTSQYDYDAATCWLEKRHLFKNSCITGSTSFFNNWVHIEDFTNESGVGDRSRYDDGYSLANEVVYNVTCDTQANLMNNYFFSSCIKQIMITPQGITLT